MSTCRFQQGSSAGPGLAPAGRHVTCTLPAIAIFFCTFWVIPESFLGFVRGVLAPCLSGKGPKAAGDCNFGWILSSGHTARQTHPSTSSACNTRAPFVPHRQVSRPDAEWNIAATWPPIPRPGKILEGLSRNRRPHALRTPTLSRQWGRAPSGPRGRGCMRLSGCASYGDWPSSLVTWSQTSICIPGIRPHVWTVKSRSIGLFTCPERP